MFALPLQLRYHSSTMTQLSDAQFKKILTGLFTESVIHDLNNPLASISLTMELLEMMAEAGDVEPEHLNRSIETITKMIETASGITKNFLKFVNFQSDVEGLFNPVDNCKMMIDFTLPIARKHNVELSIGGNEAVANAIESDLNLILLFVNYSLITGGFGIKSLTLDIQPDRIRFQADQPLTDLDRMYTKSILGSPESQHSQIQELCERNGMSLQLAGDQLELIFKTP